MSTCISLVKNGTVPRYASSRRHPRAVVVASSDHLQTSSAAPSVERRTLLALAIGTASLQCILAQPPPSSSLPLAPLGKSPPSSSTANTSSKLTNLPPTQIASILSRNLSQGQYFITGDLEPAIFTDDCRFKDPTNDIRGLERYRKALSLLFDASFSRVALDTITVTGPREITAEWRLGGYLKFPWHPRVEPFKGRTVYTLNEEGLIEMQDQTWSISGAEALRETFTPTNGPFTDVVDIMK